MKTILLLRLQKIVKWGEESKMGEDSIVLLQTVFQKKIDNADNPTIFEPGLNVSLPSSFVSKIIFKTTIKDGSQNIAVPPTAVVLTENMDYEQLCKQW